MSYRVPKGSEIQSATEKLGLFSTTMYAVIGGPHQNVPQHNRMLPLAFQATDGTLRVLRQKPVVVDSTKFAATNEHNRKYAELLMFRPWFKENEELGSASIDIETCNRMHSTYEYQIDAVREGCRRFLLEHM